MRARVGARIPSCVRYLEARCLPRFLDSLARCFLVRRIASEIYAIVVKPDFNAVKQVKWNSIAYSAL